MKMKYIDFGLTRKVPNKYNLTPKSIKELKVLDWDRLKKKCWHNNAMGGEDKPWWFILKAVMMVVGTTMRMSFGSGLMRVPERWIATSVVMVVCAIIALMNSMT